ncbi:MAG: SDR family oxidoreductase [Eubacteriales bacterium]|nr:SDR family oxidoreductase [Eubacteriales bacterium]
MTKIIDLTGKKIIVLGASSGIGRETAVTLSRAGANVILVARREQKLQEVMKALYGTGHSYFVFDLSKVNEIESLFRKIAATEGKADGMVYAAGITASYPLAMLKPEKLQQAFNINYFGFVEAVRQVCKRGRYNEGMRIVGVSSIASLCGDKAHTAYSATKSAMDSTVRCLAKELADKKICLNTVAPAMTATEMYEKFIDKYGADSQAADDLCKRQYLGIAETSDIANAIAFLISPAAKFITGITLPVDGGTTSS